MLPPCGWGNVPLSPVSSAGSLPGFPDAHEAGCAQATISIVSHGQLSLIEPLLVQIGRYSRAHIARVVLTVNVPESDALADREWGFVLERVINPAPLGFGANHNQAFARCRTPWFLVLNPDVRLEGDVIGALLAAAVPRAGVLAPRVVEPGAEGPLPHRRLLTPLEILARRHPGHVAPDRADWIAGLFMLFRKQVFRELGGFDSRRYFMYGEDFDICARLRLAGWEIQVDESHQVQHLAQRASHRDLRHLRWHVTSLLKIWSSPTFWRYRRLLRQEAAVAARPEA